MTDAEVFGPDDPYWDDGYTHDEVGEEDPLGALGAPTQSVLTAATTGPCSTAVVRGLAEQLIDEVECIQPGTMSRIDQLPGVTLGSSTFPFLQKPAATALAGAAAAHPITLGSALRTVVQQFVLYTWYQRGRCTNVVSLAAPPGRSNHESGLAVDVSDPQGDYGVLVDRGFRWLGSSDPVHFDYIGGSDLRSLSVRAFQKLWNANHPTDTISEDGSWGPQTEARVKQSPSAGFPTGPACGHTVGGDYAYPIAVGWTRQASGSYTLAASADPAIVRVEYWVDGTRIATASRSGTDFPATYTFNVAKAERLFEVRGFDSSGALVGHGVGEIDTIADTAVYIREVGRRQYEIGLERAPADVASIEVSADGFLVGDGASSVRSMFNQLGSRSFAITTYDADGSVRGTLHRTFTLE